MSKQISVKNKANYMTIFYFALIVLFCLIFKDEFIGETGNRIANETMKIVGLFGYIAVAALAAVSLAKIFFNFRLFKTKKPQYYVYTTLAIVFLAVILDVAYSDNYGFGGSMSRLIANPFQNIIGNIGTVIAFIVFEITVLFFFTASILKGFGINLFDFGKKAEVNEQESFGGSAQAPDSVPRLNYVEQKINIIDTTSPKVFAKKENRTFLGRAKDNIIDVDVKENDDYVPPRLSNFKNGDRTVQKISESELYYNSTTIISVLSAIRIEAQVTDVTIGTSVVRYEVAVKNSADIVRVERARKALLSRLRIETLSIEAPILGKDRVGIDLPNPYRQTVPFRDLVEEQKFKNASATTVALGRDITGGLVLCDLAKMPHLLIAGSTGMGKSVCLNSMIVSLLIHSTPSQVKLILIDPKRVEFNRYESVPHLLQEIVYDASVALQVLKSAVRESEQRYMLFAENNARDIDSYNVRVFHKLPKIIIIIDELAELMMSADLKKEIEFQIQRLAQKARASGIHLVVATQRPSVDVITGVIKSNLPSRIAFKLSNGIDSKTILDESGAENLLGKGDMFFKPSNFAEKLRVQGSYVSEDEIQDAVDEIILSNQSLIKEELDDLDDLNEVEDEIVANEYEKATQTNFIDKTVIKKSYVTEEDRYAEEVWEQIKNMKEIQVAILQGIFRISYSKAAELLDRFEAQGRVEQIEDELYRIIH